MKRFIKAYTSFTRTERMGLVGLCILLAALIIIKATMHLWVSPLPIAIKQGILSKTTPKRQHPATIGEIEQASEEVIPGKQSVSSRKSLESAVTFDPNTADSPTLARFGMRPVAIRNLLHWRAKGKRFYTREDLKPLYTLTAAEYQKLAPYIDISQHTINLNTADSATLIGLRGIGPVLAHKIIARRTTVGPFTGYRQLRQLYPFPDSVFEQLKKQLDPLSP